MPTKKDFEAIASAINDAGRQTSIDVRAHGLLIAAQGMADYFATANPNFNRARFMSACFRYQQEG